jgi:branched-chain amino acid transport system permease protein
MVLLGGLSYGVVLFLVATGLSLVLGLMGVVNIAHGALFMTGAYAGIWVAKSTNNIILGVLAGGVLAVFVGLFMERWFLQSLYKKELQQILVTMGFVHIITNLHLWIYGGWPETGYIPPFLSGTIQVGSYSFGVHRLAVILVGILVCPILWWLQDKTKLGAIVRAGMDDAEMVAGIGINLRPINIGAFALGSFLAGFAGVTGAPVLGGMTLQTGMDMFFFAIGVVIIGGVGSIQGSLAGAVLIGLGTTLGNMYFQKGAIYAMYVLMTLILVVRPSGLIPRR